MVSAGKQQHGKALEHSDNPETKEKLYSCSLCPKSFVNSNLLSWHRKIHTGEIPHCCLECTKSFARLEYLKRHVRLHTEEKPYSCLLCTKSFAQVSDLKKHVRIHIGEKPFQCPECPCSFPRSDRLKLHERVHTGKKLHNSDCVHCSVIHKCALRQSPYELKRHTVVHMKQLIQRFQAEWLQEKAGHENKDMRRWL